MLLLYVCFESRGASELNRDRVISSVISNQKTDGASVVNMVRAGAVLDTIAYASQEVRCETLIWIGFLVTG